MTSELPLDRRLEGMVLKVLVRDSPDLCSMPSELVFRDRAKALKQSPVCSLLITVTYMYARGTQRTCWNLFSLPLRGSLGSNSGLLVSLPMSHLCIPESTSVRQRQGPPPPGQIGPECHHRSTQGEIKASRGMKTGGPGVTGTISSLRLTA